MPTATVGRASGLAELTALGHLYLEQALYFEHPHDAERRFRAVVVHEIGISTPLLYWTVSGDFPESVGFGLSTIGETRAQGKLGHLSFARAESGRRRSQSSLRRTQFLQGLCSSH